MIITTETVFWTQLASITTFVVVLFVLYRVLVEQKDATIQLQKENIAYLKDQLIDAKSQSPDLLAQNLANRVKLFEDELKRLEQDKSSTQEQVNAKEAELKQAREEAEELSRKVLHAKELLSDFLCPYCGAPLVEKSYQEENVEHKGYEFSIDHEYIVYECGYSILDGEAGVCPSKTELSSGQKS
jgi:DNA repair exonuclease SbcCD ATPase subunit